MEGAIWSSTTSYLGGFSRRPPPLCRPQKPRNVHLFTEQSEFLRWQTQLVYLLSKWKWLLPCGSSLYTSLEKPVFEYDYHAPSPSPFAVISLRPVSLSCTCQRRVSWFYYPLSPPGIALPRRAWWNRKVICYLGEALSVRTRLWGLSVRNTVPLSSDFVTRWHCLIGTNESPLLCHSLSHRWLPICVVGHGHHVSTGLHSVPLDNERDVFVVLKWDNAYSWYVYTQKHGSV